MLCGASSIGAVGLLWLHGYRLPPLWAVVVLAAIAALAERQSVAVTEQTTMSVSLLPLVFSAVVFGPLGGFAVGAISTVWICVSRGLRWSVYTPIRGLDRRRGGSRCMDARSSSRCFGRYLLASLVAAVAYLAAEGHSSA